MTMRNDPESFDYGPEYKNGSLEILNMEHLPKDLQSVNFGLQVSWDGRVWVCIDGIAFLRFKPSAKS